jgi:hypothetical protein
MDVARYEGIIGISGFWEIDLLDLIVFALKEVCLEGISSYYHVIVYPKTDICQVEKEKISNYFIT